MSKVIIKILTINFLFDTATWTIIFLIEIISKWDKNSESSSITVPFVELVNQGLI